MISLKKYAAIAVLGFASVSIANASVITGQLFNTGLDANGNLVATPGGVDGNWDVAPSGVDAVTYFNNAYVQNDADSQWISSNQNGGTETTSSADYVFTTTFDLTGYNASTAMITGSWGVDNYATIFLNNVDTGVSLLFGQDSFRTLDAFSISENFIAGVNTLTVKVTNGYVNEPNRDPGPMALRFDDLVLTAVPEPLSIALLGLGLAGIGFSRRK